MDIKQLLYFVETAKSGSFTQAAKVLFITPQALSKSIGLLEKEYDVQLFIRQNNQLILSDIGQQVLPDAIAFLESYNTFVQGLKKLSRMESGHFHVAVAQNVLTLLDINLFNNFSLLYPEIKPDYIELPDKIVDEYIESDRVDACFNINRLPKQDEYESILLLKTELCAFESENNHSLKNKSFVRINELGNKKIVMQGEWYKVFDLLEDATRAEQVSLNYELKTADTALTLDKMTLPGYISLAPYAFHGILTNNHVNRAVPFKPSLPWNVYLSYKKDKTQSKPVQLFINYIKENYSMKTRLAPSIRN